jgi:predicted Zn-dependent protease
MQTNRRPILCIATENVPPLYITSIVAGIQEVIETAAVKVPIHQLNTEQHVGADVLPVEYKDTWGNPEWYVASSKVTAKDRECGRFNADNVLALFEESISHKTIHPYHIFLTCTAMYSEGGQNLLGWYREQVGAIVCLGSLDCLGETHRAECAKTIVMHTLGHVFGLIPMTRFIAFEENFGRHCTNTCIMRQGLIFLNNWVQFTRDRLAGTAFCPECTRNLKEYFSL